MDEVITALKKWTDAGKQTAIAIVVNKKGSAMRPVGAKMAINEDSQIVGSISGGCVENAVIVEALAVMRSGEPKLLHYGVSDDTAWSVGLMCGGEIDVVLLPVRSGGEGSFERVVVDKLGILQDRRQPYMMLVLLSGKKFGHSCLLENLDGKIDNNAAAWVERSQMPVLEEMMRTERSQILETAAGQVFVDVGKPAPRLVVIGGAHVSIAFVKLAKVLGYYTILIDPRKTFATEERFPEIDEMHGEWPEEGFEKIGLNSGDYVLLASHDDKLDLPAASAALNADATYIGMLASRTTRARRYQLLQEEGFSKEQVEKIHAPVGLDIGARTPEEIALAMLAEITAHRYGKLA
ncbi:MAG: xanthine dehydrogenase accessory factor [Chloroflexota bacterium]|nr:xanthine dehydrogenase accessory factor [Chloroflexota bacterium]